MSVSVRLCVHIHISEDSSAYMCGVHAYTQAEQPGKKDEKMFRGIVKLALSVLDPEVHFFYFYFYFFLSGGFRVQGSKLARLSGFFVCVCSSRGI